ncbi:MAG: ATP-dependent endonuclease, partial [Bacteroidia bacterium]
MKIEFVEIQNFRKLKSCRIDFAAKETVFVGSNNSGKTSAMDALILFLKEKSKFSTRDFTLSNWKNINEIGNLWITKDPLDTQDLLIEKWQEFLPSLDVWINVESSEIHYVNHLIPTLDWKGGLLGIRFRLEPKNIEDLYRDYHTSFNSSKKTTEEAKKEKAEISLKLWPKSMWNFIEKKLHNHFDIRSYILDPTKLQEPINGDAKPQLLSNNLPLDKAPFEGLIKIDVINAQRGFSDPNSDTSSLPKLTGNLSTQLREYYTKHLNPSEQPNASDIAALQSIENAKTTFDEKLKHSFNPSITELELLNYPGFGNPSINISSQVNVIDGLKHEAAVQFGLLKQDATSPDFPLSLPEKYNGLGYQNLISMVFKLIRFRDEWMQVGKSMKPVAESVEFEPLHLVLVEEPEAHLHAQVQQVFIRKAYEVLRNNPLLKENTEFTTQLIVSTHSNHIAHEINFASLRYFRRKNAEAGKVPTSTVVNLSKTFGTADETTKFAIRYLKTTHCDLFFADAAILIEGPAERMLVPHFISHHYPALTSCYISMLEIGGSHAHTLRPLIEDLGIITLVITDIDSIEPTGGTSIQPEKGKGYETGNYTLRSWLPKKGNLDELLGLTESEKEDKDFPVKVAYQIPLNVTFKNSTEEKIEEVLPYTFEDALVFENIELFKTLPGNGLIKKFKEASKKMNSKDAIKDMFEALTN